MKQPHSTLRWPVLTALVLTAALGACSRHQDDELTAGQRLDGAIADAKQTARETTADAKQAVSEAETSAARASSDMAITAKVNAALAVDDKLKATQINVDTRDGQVTLTGQAPDATSRERATTLASAVDGVKQVNNQLVVDRNG
ncbi:BON domain-containing protein [Roseateles sp.]|jgi:hyperosmotically inducible protein|uniref:BON domain-containing protein n=1 Tax=Roseateles sp. TaxID=1971397 RepID=UPI003BACB521